MEEVKPVSSLGPTVPIRLIGIDGRVADIDEWPLSETRAELRITTPKTSWLDFSNGETVETGGIEKVFRCDGTVDGILTYREVARG